MAQAVHIKLTGTPTIHNLCNQLLLAHWPLTHPPTSHSPPFLVGPPQLTVTRTALTASPPLWVGAQPVSHRTGPTSMCPGSSPPPSYMPPTPTRVSLEPAPRPSPGGPLTTPPNWSIHGPIRLIGGGSRVQEGAPGRVPATTPDHSPWRTPDRSSLGGLPPCHPPPAGYHP